MHRLLSDQSTSAPPPPENLELLYTQPHNLLAIGTPYERIGERRALELRDSQATIAR